MDLLTLFIFSFESIHIRSVEDRKADKKNVAE
jgi:hypothetical protein